MSQRSETTQIFNIDQSFYLSTGLIILHATALVVVLMITITLPFQLALIGLILISLWRHFRYSIKFHRFSLRHNNDASVWEISTQEADYKTFHVLPSTVLTPYVIFLHIKGFNNKTVAFPIIKPALKKDNFRKLRVSLKISGVTV